MCPVPPSVAPQGSSAAARQAPARAWIAALPESQRPHRWAAVDPSALGPQVWVRDLCVENRCGKFGRHPCCPPEVGSLEACRARIATYSHAVVLATTFEVDASDRGAVRRTRRAFQETTLALRVAAQRLGLPPRGAERSGGPAEAPAVRAAAPAVPAGNLGPWVWALPGGTCALCDPCPAETGGACPRPEDAHPSLEALGVDVMGLLERLGWDTAFHPDRVTWVGALLWRSPGREAAGAARPGGAAGRAAVAGPAPAAGSGAAGEGAP